MARSLGMVVTDVYGRQRILM